MAGTTPQAFGLALDGVVRSGPGYGLRLCNLDGRGPPVVSVEVQTGLAVTATLMSDKPVHFETHLQETDSNAPTFLAPHQITLHTPIKLETRECLWMGTVCTCFPEGPVWRVTLKIEHCLRNLPELLKLAARFE